jgi:hypothetical protein
MPTTITKILPPAPMPANATYASATSTPARILWDEEAAQADAFNQNNNAAQTYLTYTFPSWVTNYESGRANNTVPPIPPTTLYVQVQETGNDDGTVSFDYQPMPDPSGSWVCAVPYYTPIPPPAPPGSGKIANPPQSVTVTLPSGVAVNAMATASDGSKWFRIS